MFKKGDMVKLINNTSNFGGLKLDEQQWLDENINKTFIVDRMLFRDVVLVSSAPRGYNMNRFKLAHRYLNIPED